MDRKLYEQFKQYDDAKKISLLKDTVFRDYLLSEPRLDSFKLVLMHINDDMLEALFDERLINAIITSNNISDILTIFVQLNNPIINEFLKNEVIINHLVTKFSHSNEVIIHRISDLEIVKLMFANIINDNVDCFDSLRICKSSTLICLFSDFNNIESIIKKNIDVSTFLSKCNMSVAKQLLNINYFKNIIVNKLDLFVLANFIIKGIDFSRDDLSIVANRFASIKSPAQYREYMNFFDDEGLYDIVKYIDSKRNKVYDNIVDSTDERGIIPYFKDNDPEDMEIQNIDFDDQLSKLYLCRKRLIEIFVDRYFKDIPINFLINLKELVRYINNTSVNIIDPDRFQLYVDIIEALSSGLANIVSLYKSMDKNFDYVSQFYDDYRIAKNHSYESIRKSLLVPEKQPLYKESKQIYDVPIYALSGQVFNALVHVTECERNDINGVYWFDDPAIETISLSYINEQKIGMFSDPNNMVVLGFSDFNIDQVAHVFHNDSFTDNLEGSKRINEIHSPKSLIKKTDVYNEILYYHFPNNLFPNYVLAYGKIKHGDLQTAKNLGIPIVLLNTFMYDFKKPGSIILSGDNYYTADESLKVLELK